MYFSCKHDSEKTNIDWKTTRFVSSTVLIQARKAEHTPTLTVQDFIQANIGASDFARHISISQLKKAKVVKWLFESLIKRPFVKIAAGSFSTTTMLTTRMASALMNLKPKTPEARLD